jgi:hypothetical protein
MDRPTVMFHIDSETLNDLSHANDELIQSLHWLLARRDLAAFEKLYPIVRRITDLILAILEGAFRKCLALATRSIGSPTR